VLILSTPKYFPSLATIRPNLPSVAVMSVICASLALAARSGREMLEGSGSGRDSESSEIRALRIAQEMPRGLKEGRP